MSGSSRELLLERLAGVLRQRLFILCRHRLASLVHRLEHIREPRLRGISFLSRLRSDPVEVSVEMLYALERMTAARHPEAQKLFLALLDEPMVRQMLPPDTIERIWRYGRVRGYHRMLEVFFYTHSTDRRLEEIPRLPPDIREIPLGRRKALARQGAIGVLERLSLDNDVTVIRNLLANPRVTEREVIRIAAKRPNTPAILAAVAADRRWIAYYAVKKALIHNPDTPVAIAVPLVKFLLREDLREIVGLASVHEMLKRAAREVLDRRAGERGWTGFR